MQCNLGLEGFREVQQNLTEMIERVANDPSVGLFFVQQHIHKAVPILVSIKAQAVGTTQEAAVCTEDMKDATSSVKSMKECGPPIIEQMIKNLNASISLMSSMHRLGEQHGQSNISGRENVVLTTLGSAFQTASKVTWRSHRPDVHESGSHLAEIGSSKQNYGGAVEGQSSADLGTSKSFVQSVFKSAFQRAGTFGWSGISKVENAVESSNKILTRRSSAGSMEDDVALLTAETVFQEPTDILSSETHSSIHIEESRQLQLSGQSLLRNIDRSQRHILDEAPVDSIPKLNAQALELAENFEQFHAEHVAKLEAWLSEPDECSSSNFQEYDLRPVV